MNRCSSSCASHAHNLTFFIIRICHSETTSAPTFFLGPRSSDKAAQSQFNNSAQSSSNDKFDASSGIWNQCWFFLLHSVWLLVGLLHLGPSALTCRSNMIQWRHVTNELFICHIISPEKIEQLPIQALSPKNAVALFGHQAVNTFTNYYRTKNMKP